MTKIIVKYEDMDHLLIWTMKLVHSRCEFTVSKNALGWVIVLDKMELLDAVAFVPNTGLFSRIIGAVDVNEDSINPDVLGFIKQEAFAEGEHQPFYDIEALWGDVTSGRVECPEDLRPLLEDFARQVADLGCWWVRFD